MKRVHLAPETQCFLRISRWAVIRTLERMRAVLTVPHLITNFFHVEECVKELRSSRQSLAAVELHVAFEFPERADIFSNSTCTRRWVRFQTFAKHVPE